MALGHNTGANYFEFYRMPIVKLNKHISTANEVFKQK